MIFPSDETIRIYTVTHTETGRVVGKFTARRAARLAIKTLQKTKPDVAYAWTEEVVYGSYADWKFHGGLAAATKDC